jgi:hypothetical protein
VDKVVGEVEVLDHLLEQVLGGGFLDSFGGVGVAVGDGEIEVSTDSDVTVVMIDGLHLQGGEEVKETLPSGEITSGAVTIEGSPEVGFVI